ncbi:hypothetical protein HBH1_03774 [Herbaspirillum sp. BH-1]|uniref:Virulence factor n=2 Tax=Herbaspirillum frisingense TaxID=92645 RepID=A0AAI9I9N2_9BURK|nr:MULTISPECIES: hypothetical protein [Herbaspirillum]EOA02146.1 hypothetical protein HFRIS_023962 [Herbaspirillum frisingense GSF30]MDR6582006.1 hypothetical protein [Herbaspirillum frisingense]ONN65387.1 hypothetical protein BTM36_15495 [Herbaspirillum sp. VT-16-41]PLY57951.1 hypothetical protein HBH1_03774 [Herbaspirillum sp. BH-1]
MKKSIPLMAGLAVFAAVAGLSAAPAMAGHVSIGVNIGVPGAYVAPQPVYVQPAPVYAPPPPVYVRPAPVYYGPPPVYVAPGYYRGHHHRHWHRPPPPPGYWHR